MALPTYEDAARSDSIAFRTTFACLSLHSTDTLRMSRFPESVITDVRSTISSNWYGGIQREGNFCRSHEFKLRGTPWTAKDVDAVTSRQLLSSILASLFTQGWVLTLSTDVSKSQTDLDTLLFRYQSSAPAPCQWMSISFSNKDQIRFITDPKASFDAVAAVVDAYIRLEGSAIQRHAPHTVAGCYEVKMLGTPWRAWGAETMHARSLLLNLLTALDQFGWTVYASVDQKKLTTNKNLHHGDTDTWHCCRRVDWQPGMPVFHH